MPSGGRFIGGIKFGVSMDTRRLNRDVAKSRKTISRFTGQVTRHFATVGAFGAAATAAFTALTKSQFNAVDTLAKTADKLGVTTESLAGMRHAADLTGVNVNQFDTALQRMTRRINEAGIGTGEAVKALGELGLNAGKLSKLTVDQQFFRVADAMGRVDGQGNKVRLAFKLFDSEGVALVNTLKLGSKGLFDAAAEADRLGLSVSRIEAAQIEAANDAVTKMRKSFVGIGRMAAVEFAPFVTDVADQIRGMTAEFRGFKDTAISSVDLSGGLLGQAGDMAGLIKDSFLGLQSVMTRTISLAVDKLTDLSQFIARMVRRLEVLPLIGDKAKGIADSLSGDNFLTDFSRELQRQSDITSKRFNDSFTGKTFSERLRQRQAAPKATSPDLKQTDLFSALTSFGGNLLQKGKNQLLSYGQIGNGITNNPLNRLVFASIGPAIKAMQAPYLSQGNSLSTKQAQLPPGPGYKNQLTFSKVGSAEAYRQNARIRNQRKQAESDNERNKLLKQIRDKMNSQPELKPAPIRGG